MNSSVTGSQKVGGSNPPSSTREANQYSQHLSIPSNSCTQLAIPFGGKSHLPPQLVASNGILRLKIDGINCIMIRETGSNNA